MKKGLSLYLQEAIILFVLWLGLTGSFNLQELITGGVLAVIIPLLTPYPLSDMGLKWLSPKRIIGVVLYLLVFLKALFIANIDVAKRVLSPGLNINPGIVKIKTTLKTNVGKMLLANSITLTPGTLTVDVKGEYLYIHWINVETQNIEEATKIIAGDFENLIKSIVE
jgi:multicomponent Na+:H+ antiporter subunit E